MVSIHFSYMVTTISRYFLVTSNYFLYGETLMEQFGVVINSGPDFLGIRDRYHRFHQLPVSCAILRLISFAMYILGFVWFVLSLVKKYYLRQFSLFAWTHVALLCVVTQSYLIIQNMFEGLIWFIMPIMMVIINDIMAYMFGFTMGRTPLIKLSPKKTWEGFIGGGIATVFMSLGLAYLMCQVRTLYTFKNLHLNLSRRCPTLFARLCTAVSWSG